MSEDGLVKLTDPQIKNAKECFQGFDKKGEEKIKIGEIANVFKKMGQNISAEMLETFEEDIDEEGTGFIDWDEFQMVYRKKIQAEEDERELKECFRVLDKERKGEVNVNEIRHILKALGDDLTEGEIDDMIADVDTDGSGWVDYDEFAKLMNG